MKRRAVNSESSFVVLFSFLLLAGSPSSHSAFPLFSVNLCCVVGSSLLCSRPFVAHHFSFPSAPALSLIFVILLLLLSQSLLRGWQLFALATETFLPSPALLPFVDHYLSRCAGGYRITTTSSSSSSPSSSSAAAATAADSIGIPGKLTLLLLFFFIKQQILRKTEKRKGRE